MSLRTILEKVKSYDAVSLFADGYKGTPDFIVPDPYLELDRIIYRSLLIKKAVVEEDEKESGLRMAPNFGHTVGHAIESERELHGLYHGECVALGMLPMVSDAVRARLLPLLEKLSLPTTVTLDKNRAYQALLHDKKSDVDSITAVIADEIGSFRFEKIPVFEMIAYLDYFDKDAVTSQEISEYANEVGWNTYETYAGNIQSFDNCQAFYDWCNKTIKNYNK